MALGILIALLQIVGARPQPTPRLVVGSVLFEASGGLLEDRIIDAAVAKDGSVFALLGSSTIVRLERGRSEPLSVFGGKGTRLGHFIRPTGLAVSEDQRVLVFDAGLNAITVFDWYGRPLERSIINVPFISFVSMTVASSGDVFLSGFTPEVPTGQVYRICSRLDCDPIPLGGTRATRDSSAAQFFQGGYLANGVGGVLFAGVNPLRINRFDVATARWDTLVVSDLLVDAEQVAFRRLPNGQTSFSNAFPQTTNLQELPDASVAYSAFFPAKASSVFLLFDPAYRIALAAELPAFISLEGVFPDGDLLVRRMVSKEQLVVYRLER